MGQSIDEEAERQEEPQESQWRPRTYKATMVAALVVVVVVVVLVVTLVFTTKSEAETPSETPVLKQSTSLQFRLYGMSGLNDTAFFEETCSSFYATHLEELENVECKVAARRQLQGTTLRYITVPVFITGESTTRLNLLGTVQFVMNEYGEDFVQNLKQNDEFLDLKAVQAVDTDSTELTFSPTMAPVSSNSTSTTNATGSPIVVASNLTERPINQTAQPSRAPIPLNTTKLPSSQVPTNTTMTSAPTPTSSLNSTGSPTGSPVNSSNVSTTTAPSPVPQPLRFPFEKQEIDSVCSLSTFSRDEGALCMEACVPQFFKCCNPFDEFELEYDDATTSLLDGYEDYDDSECSLDIDLQGCMSYAKCQALTGQFDPAPANLPHLCSFDRIRNDPESCQQTCSKLDCCFSTGSDNCLAKRFDICLDYAPCQNLRILEVGPDAVLPTAPKTLDIDCLWQQPSCVENCAPAANCCTDPTSSVCFQFNFLSCLTYAPCDGVAVEKFSLPKQFVHVPEPPLDLVYACNSNSAPILVPTEKTCLELCSEAACCFSVNPDDNCFHRDPLGCLAWDAQCQVLKP